MQSVRGAWKDAVSRTMELKSTLAVVVLVVLFCPTFSQELNPKGRNVCRVPGTPGSVCCSGWGQLGDECLTPLCEGNFTCKENEVCVRPNECRCRHGYFGASCDTKCPAQFWGPDCKGKCTCHPNGKCDDVTGKCTCHPNRWGEICEKPCPCQKGKCDQETGRCACHPGFWGPHCSNTCYCSVNSVCEQTTGRCLCSPGWYGRNCRAQCVCNGSPCEQLTGRCQCRERLWGPSCERYCQCMHGKCNQVDGSCTCNLGYRGKYCREPCPAGFYGQSCRNRCGHCKGQQPCEVIMGRCVTCERGWNGTKCDQMCAPGFFGENCKDECPPCKDGHYCNRMDGKCSHCNPGWIGDRCEVRCPNGTYGENCENDCSHCFNRVCHFATGECLCDPGFYGTYCNLTCESGQFGVNCAQTCPCHDKNCDPVSGACNLYPNQRMGVIAAATLVSFLLLILLLLLCCCFFCGNKYRNSLDQDNYTNSKKAKRILCGRFSRISTKLPRIPLRRQKMPKIVVASHDPESNFNCSFIEPPSAVEQPTPSWSSQESFSSFETSEDGPVYCVPHEDTVNESNVRPSPNIPAENMVGISEEDAGEYTSLKETQTATKQPSSDASKQPLLKSSDSEGSTSSSEPTMGELYARITRLSKNSKEEEDGGTADTKANDKPPSPGRTKPRPPDPSTKPKVSWIHGTSGAGQSEKGHAPSPPKEKKRISSEGSGKGEEKHRSKEKLNKKGEQKNQDGKKSDGNESPSKSKAHKASDPIEHINGAVQNALKKIGNFHSERKGDTAKEPPKSPNIMHPHMNSEAATLLAAQLKEKTQSLNRNDGLSVGIKPNGVSTPQASREKPTPPQKAKRSVTGTNKPLLPTSSNLQKMVAPVTDSSTPDSKTPEKQAINGTKVVGAADPTPKKTPIKKPPRKKGKDGTAETEPKTTPKTAIMPPQIVK
ncbi:scavenger receptor class F member 2 isoform X1 [Electrophorus electricus]|uniref:scavenger receptor class F member 2 isoform X1 n=1 Tax=Electrophorus electricus TaxID=8005 RepID=UPI0015CFF9F4|nr:scavenger receptor class F member 2 isoform X1 [Electrophorus electricus]XP_026866418.2 scavenger receptor class F member 2 isoform X1 [Electrophorus electricus]